MEANTLLQIQLLTFGHYSSSLFLFKNDVSETGLCLQPIELSPDIENSDKEIHQIKKRAIKKDKYG